MRNMLILFFTLALINNLSAQISNTNYALPSDATDVTNIVSNIPDAVLTLTESGIVPGESNSTCDGQVNGIYNNSVSFQLYHYYDKINLNFL